MNIHTYYSTIHNARLQNQVIHQEMDKENVVYTTQQNFIQPLKKKGTELCCLLINDCKLDIIILSKISQVPGQICFSLIHGFYTEHLKAHAHKILKFFFLAIIRQNTAIWLKQNQNQTLKCCMGLEDIPHLLLEWCHRWISVITEHEEVSHWLKAKTKILGPF